MVSFERVKPSDPESSYFAAREAELRKAIRDRLEEQAEQLTAHRSVAERVGTDDSELAARIHALGFDGDAASIFDLLPLVHVAWADGSIQRNERTSILRLVQQRGFAPGSEPFQLMESLLEERPSAAYMRETLNLLRELVANRTDRASEIVGLCMEVASASGGFLGLGDPIHPNEKATLEEIVASLGPGAAERFQKSLA